MDNNKYMRQYTFNRYHRRRAWAIQHLGGKCAKCSSTSDLEIDHIDPHSKSFSIGQLWKRKWSIFIEEINKCQLLCKACHNLKTIIEKGQTPTKNRDVHGTLTSYRYCKCKLCKEAHNAYCKEWKRNHRKSKGSQQRRSIGERMTLGKQFSELHNNGQSDYQIGTAYNMPHATVQRYRKIFESCQVSCQKTS